MELRQIMQLIGKWAWMILLAAIIAGTASFFASNAMTPLYKTKTTLMVGRATESLNPYAAYNIYSAQQLALTFAQLTKSKPVLQGAIDSLGLDLDWQALSNQVNAQPIENTELLQISVIDSDPYRAKLFADAIAEQLVMQSSAKLSKKNNVQTEFTQEQMQDLEDKIKNAQEEIQKLRTQLDDASSARQIQELETKINALENKISNWQNTYAQMLLSIEGSDFNALTIVEDATVPAFPFSPNIKLNVVTAAIIGLLLAIGGALLIEYLDDTVKTSDDIEKLVGLPTLATISFINGENYNDKLIAANNPMDPVVEAFRIMRTNLQFSSLDKPARTIMLTSPNPAEGKSLTIANLAVTIAQSGKKVIIVDTDLRKPVQHNIFKLSNHHGFSEIIINTETNITDILQSTGVENLWLLNSGVLPPNPAELLGSERIRAIIHELISYADIVLFDSAPVLPVSDAIILSTRVDGIIVICEAGKTRKNELKRAVQELERVHAHILGVLLNRVAKHSKHYYYSIYYGESKKKEKAANKKTNKTKETQIASIKSPQRK